MDWLSGIIVGAGGTLLAAFVLAVFLGLRRRLRRRLRAPVAIRFSASEIYAGDTGVIALVPTARLDEYGHGISESNTTVNAEGAFVAGTPLVLSLGNTSSASDPRSIRIREVELSLRDYWPLSLSVENKSVVQSSVIQAGGRGSEGWIVVQLKGTERIRIPLLATLAAETSGSARGLLIEHDKSAEVTILTFPLDEGRYAFDLAILVEEDGVESRHIAAKGVSIVSCNNLAWAERYVRTFVWGDPTDVGTENLAPLWDRWSQLQAQWLAGCEPPPDGRRVRVCGSLDPVAWG